MIIVLVRSPVRRHDRRVANYPIIINGNPSPKHFQWVKSPPGLKTGLARDPLSDPSPLRKTRLSGKFWVQHPGCLEAAEAAARQPPASCSAALGRLLTKPGSIL